jgi:hypothetical protein
MPPTLLRHLGRQGKVVLNSGEVLSVRYSVVEADSLIVSHRTGLFERDPLYPVAAQPRDYEAEKELQLAVDVRASNLDADQILTDSVLPIDGPPVLLQNGVVLSGNGRAQSILLSIARGTYDGVRAEVVRRAPSYGLDSERISQMRGPVLVRVLDKLVTNEDELARYGLEMNRDPAQGMSASEQSAALSRLMTASVVERLADLAASMPADFTVREFMRRRATKVRDILGDAGLVDSRKRAAYFTDDGDLTEAAKELLENALAGLTVTDTRVVRRASKSTRDRLARVGMAFLQMRRAGPAWDIARFNTQAVSLRTAAEDWSAYLRTLKGPAGTRESLVERFLHPERFDGATIEFDYGSQATALGINPTTEALAMALEEAPRSYAELIGRYAHRAMHCGETMFGTLHPWEVFGSTIGTHKNENDEVLWNFRITPEKWAR